MSADLYEELFGEDGTLKGATGSKENLGVGSDPSGDDFDIWTTIFYGILFYMLFRRWFAEDPNARANAMKKATLKCDIENLRTRKTARIAYTYYFYGGFLTGSHHIYLGNHTYALLHQGTFGFFGIGMLVDAVLMNYYVAKANVGCHPDAKTDVWPWRAVAIPFAFMFGILFILILTPLAFEWTGGIEPYKDENPYKILGITRGTPFSEVKTHFRKTSIQYHPDKNPESKRKECEDKMRELTEAYEKIKKLSKREKESKETDGKKKKKKERSWIDRLIGEDEDGNVDDRADASWLEDLLYRSFRGWYQIAINYVPVDLNAWAEEILKDAEKSKKEKKKKKKN